MKYGQPEIKINKNDKKIFIKRNNLNDKVIFSGGNLNDWHIKMEDFSLFKNQYYSGIDKNNLTGCLNFYDIEVKNLTLVYENSKCEDAINFVRAKGTINNLTITNSFFDAMDADYSNLKFKDIFVNKSMNDCLDFSFGIYEVEKSSISFCGDKAVSVGEKSILKIFNSNISDSNSGVVSKDYATVNISNSKIINTKYCFQAYNKKKEFSGGQLISNKNYCEFNVKIALVDKSSKIILNNENFLKFEDSKGIKGVYNGI